MRLHSNRHPELLAALDQLVFFLMILLVGYLAVLLCGFRWLGLDSYGQLVLLLSPLIAVSSLFAARLSRRHPHPIEPRDRGKLREIRPQKPAADDFRHVA